MCENEQVRKKPGREKGEMHVPFLSPPRCPSPSSVVQNPVSLAHRPSSRMSTARHFAAGRFHPRQQLASSPGIYWISWTVCLGRRQPARFLAAVTCTPNRSPQVIEILKVKSNVLSTNLSRFGVTGCHDGSHRGATGRSLAQEGPGWIFRPPPIPPASSRGGPRPKLSRSVTGCPKPSVPVTLAH